MPLRMEGEIPVGGRPFLPLHWTDLREEHEAIAKRLLPRYIPTKESRGMFERPFFLDAEHFAKSITVAIAANPPKPRQPLDDLKRMKTEYAKAVEGHKPSNEAFAAFKAEANRRLEGDLNDFLAQARTGTLDEETLALLPQREAETVRKKFNAYCSMINTGKLGDLQKAIAANELEYAQATVPTPDSGTVRDAAYSLLAERLGGAITDKDIGPSPLLLDKLVANAGGYKADDLHGFLEQDSSYAKERNELQEIVLSALWDKQSERALVAVRMMLKMDKKVLGFQAR